MTQLTIGDMLDKLDTYDLEAPIKILTTVDLLAKVRGIQTTQMFFSGQFESYRGYYDEMHLAYSSVDHECDTVAKLQQVLQKAIARGMMFGYKGREYEINLHTPVWLAFDSGDPSNLFVSDICLVEGAVTVIASESR